LKEKSIFLQKIFAQYSTLIFPVKNIDFCGNIFYKF